MKVMSKIVLATLVGGLVAFGAGCGQEALPAGKSPEDVIKEALLNQKEITKSVYEVSLNADLKGDVDGEKNDLKGTGSLKGSSNADTKDNSLALTVDGTMNGEGLKANLEVRANKDGVFMLLNKVEFSNKDTQDMVDLFAGDYKGKWTKLSFMKSDDVNMSGTFTVDYAEGDELPFKNIEYKGTKDVLGIKSYLFAAKVDNEMLIKMMEDKGQSGSEAMFKDAEITAEIFTAVNEKIFTGFNMTAKLKATEMNGTLSLSFMINPTKADTVQTPKFEKEITEEDIMGLMGAGEVAPTDTYDYDTSAYDSSSLDLPTEEMTDEELEALMSEIEAAQ